MRIESTSEIRNWLRISWRRSREALGDNDSPTADFVEERATDSVFLRAARPVLAAMSAEIENEPVSLILTDNKSTVLSRNGGDRGLLKALDRVHLAPGFVYAESAVGTNGIGTALEVGAPILIDGTEHYAGPLQSFSCAGALVTHPTSGALLGVVDLTTEARHANSLLLPFAKLAAHRIRERILDDASERERALLHSYHAACHHSGRPVIAIGENVLMVNALAQEQFDSRDQAVIIERTRDTSGRAKPATFLADLPSGVTARLSYEPTFVNDRVAGGIIRIKETVRRSPGPRIVKYPDPPSIARMSALWRHAFRDVAESCTRREWLVLDGESGTGKAALARAAHGHVTRGRALVVLDAARLGGKVLAQADAELEGGADLLIRHADALSEADLDALSDMLQPLREGSHAEESWIALTVRPGEGCNSFASFRLFPKTVTVPPLRHRAEDIPQLTRDMLRAIGADDVVLSAASLNQLARLRWPGNAAQLRSVLEELHRRHRSGLIEPHQLPPECKATTRRTLSKIETLERDAIVDALTLHEGDKVRAATALGISRATIYRKIREFGIRI
ncbi:sigma-54-dependent Fis family transcriptional regulator [Hoyosella subflava]|uniref:Possible transcriptional regulator n=1 Tax=Hoyosella subflava (strain DSM 45089 / JCM 17490 / NBRC 109087 / DQS3-9A1) TaxID=443218 RepID=F6EQC4_HOYSD|nr:helix-turn-helix domain-containing protein [Hoyosella subflava]AEF40609.1 Possible transcriptional regulator [Hoyosella subflava DQS3-9A1]